jgi:uncharacterized repeat protein (TIGR03803 family)
MSNGHNMGNRSRVGLRLLGPAAMIAAFLAPIGEAAAASYQVLYSFCSQSGCRDGAGPTGVVMDGAGNLYGTTSFGGASFPGWGVVFKLAPDGTESVLHYFCSLSGCADGANPEASLIVDAAGDSIYGTTKGSGAGNGGVVFTIYRRPPPFEAYYRYRVLYPFCAQSGCADGANPEARLVMDADGNLYGTTINGGASDAGVAFELAPGLTETVLHSFCAQSGCADGYNPEAGLVMDADGNLYGTTRNGGAPDAGVVFKLATDGTYAVLYRFCQQSGCADGYWPSADLTIDAAGNLYGTTFGGGAYGTYNGGVVFKLAPDGTYTVLHTFCSQSGCVDGSNPVASLSMDAAGNLYGTASGGGTGTIPGGVVFELTPDGTYTVLHNFCSQAACVDGTGPGAGLIMDAAANLYGIAGGGASNLGVVFKLSP